MSGYRHGSPVQARAVADQLLVSSVLAAERGAAGFASVMRQGSATIREQEIENDRLRKLLDEANAKLGLLK